MDLKCKTSLLLIVFHVSQTTKRRQITRVKALTPNQILAEIAIVQKEEEVDEHSTKGGSGTVEFIL